MNNAESLAISRDDSGLGPKCSRSEHLASHYELIGKTLSICEASCLQVGVPWFPPTRPVRDLVKQYESPVSDFVRYSLVGVNTNTLELYCDDLEIMPITVESLSSLSLRIPSLFERFALCGLIVPAVFGASLAGSITLKVTISSALLISLLAAFIVGTGSVMLCSEPHRRYSFHRLVYHEILRRRGLDQTTTNRMRIMPVETKPLSE